MQGEEYSYSFFYPPRSRILVAMFIRDILKSEFASSN
jgi:hypothetical protein